MLEVAGSVLRAFARGLSKKHNLSGVVVDYLQLMSSNSKSERYAQVTEFSRQMKVLAKDFGVPVVAATIGRVPPPAPSPKPGPRSQKDAAAFN